MSNGPKSPSRPTVKRLFALSGNRCAFPECPTPLVDRETGSIIGEVCHIKGEKPTAPRFDEAQDNYSRHRFENLVLLCNVHHKVIDDNEDDFSTDYLIAMKEMHESRQNEREPLDDSTSEAFAEAMVSSFGDQNEVVQASHVSGGQVAHTIINNPKLPDDEEVLIEGKTSISAGREPVGCPYLMLTVICRSKRPARIRRAIISLLDHGIVAAIEAGFEEKLGYTPLPGSYEELTVELHPTQSPNSPNGFVLQQDDVVRFILPVLAAPVSLFLIRPEKAMSLKVVFFDDSEQAVVDGNELKPQLQGLVEFAQNVPCERRFPDVKFNIRVKSTTKPNISGVGKTNPNPIHFGLRVGCPLPDADQSPPQEDIKTIRWFERKGNFVEYPEVLQGHLSHCVYAAISAAVNYMAGTEIWSPDDLFNEHKRIGGGAANFDIADTALKPVADNVEKYHHNKDNSSTQLTPNLIREWIDKGGVVILSMELRNDEVSQSGGGHMFSLMAYESNRFQVWDTNGLKGFLTDEEIVIGFYYPNGYYFMPHDNEDTLIFRRKN